MFGKDQLILSKPGEIKTVAKSFTDNFRKISSEKKVSKARPAPITANNRQVQQKTSIKHDATPETYQLKKENLKEIQLEIKKNSIKLEVIRPYATNFLKKVSRLDEIKEEENKAEGKIIFSYSDSKGSWGNLAAKGEKIKITVRSTSNNEFEEEKIDISSLANNDIKPSGVYVQVKGWGNLKELSLLNALKNSGSRLGQINSGNKKEWIIFSYTLSSMTSLTDGGWECKVRVVPGKSG